MNKGSEWHIWDLHVHTPASIVNHFEAGSVGDVWENYIQDLEHLPKEVKVLGINDYLFIDGYKKVLDYKKQGRLSNINLILPVVEFRLAQFGGNERFRRVNFHVIFSDKVEADIIQAQFLNALSSKYILSPEYQSLSWGGVITYDNLRDLGKRIIDSVPESEKGKFGSDLIEGFNNLNLNYNDIIGALTNASQYFEGNYLTAIGKTEWEDIKWNDNSIADKKNIINSVDFVFTASESSKAYNAGLLKLTESHVNNRLLDCSDAHHNANSSDKDRLGNCNCWIKADTTFEGLKQVLAEPSRICYETPDLLVRIKKSPDKFIKRIEINRIPTASMQEVWFNNINIDVNPGMVAIIGNKGSGKSAIADVIALCADSSNQNWAFLTQSKFRMSKPYNRSKQIEASLEWYDGSHTAKKTLDLNSDLTQPERVKYIPQNFLESLCTTEDDQEFEVELKKIIFQYLDPTQRFGKNDLDSIIQYLSLENSISCDDLKAQIKTVNEEIIRLEDMQAPEYRSKLANQLKYRQEQLSNAQSAKPAEVKKPDLAGNTEAQKAKAVIDALQLQKEKLEDLIKQEQNMQTANNKNKQDLTSSKERLDRVSSQLSEILSTLKPVFESNDLDIDSIFKFEYHPNLIISKINFLNASIKQTNEKLDEEKESSLANQLKIVQKQLDDARMKMSEPERKYQDYLRQKQEWEKTIEEITGAPDKEGSIKQLQAAIEYVDRKLEGDLLAQKQNRKDLLVQLMTKKSEVLSTYNSLFEPIVQFIEVYREKLKDYPIEFDATFAIREFSAHFFDIVSQQAAGSFYGKEQGMERVKNIIEEIDLTNIDAIVNFPILINNALQKDKREGNEGTIRKVVSQLKKDHSKQELYDYIYSMDYVVPFFQLKMNGKLLSSLSPGERGALLLLLYLFIDMDDKPLIIDQPEENLDNESVFRYLVHFIKEAKKKRQIIIVTHNPNLAVVCDADQIIRMNIDKQHGNVVSFESGAIENPVINKHVVDILEGTYPAFHNRDCKYMEKTI